MEPTENTGEYKYDSNSISEKLRDMTDKYSDPHVKSRKEFIEVEVYEIDSEMPYESIDLHVESYEEFVMSMPVLKGSFGRAGGYIHSGPTCIKLTESHEKPLFKYFEVDLDVLSKFVWPDQGPSKGFFGVLTQHGGIYVKNILTSGNIDVEMNIPIGDISLLEFLDKIFHGKIPVDCSLFLQILLQKDFKNKEITLGLGPSADGGIDTHAHIAKLDIGHYSTKDVTLQALLQKSSCIAKSQWVIRTGLDQYLGMTTDGPKVNSDLEWRTHMSNGINRWIRDDDNLCFEGTLLQQAMHGLYIADVMVHCKENDITIDADQIKFVANQLESILSFSNSFMDSMNETLEKLLINTCVFDRGAEDISPRIRVEEVD